MISLDVTQLSCDHYVTQLISPVRT